MAKSLLEKGTFEVKSSRIDVRRGPDGRWYSKYPLMYVAQAVPAVFLREHVREWVNDVALVQWLPATVPHAITATIAVGVMQLGLAFGASMLSAVLLGLSVVFTTPLWVSGRTLYSEPLQALVFVYVILAAVRARDETRRSAFAWLGLLAGIALNTKITLGILPVAVLVDQLHERWTRRRVIHLFGITLPCALIGVVAWLAYNKLRYGSVLAQGYSADRDGSIGFGVPLIAGLYGLTLSTGKSVFLYAPILLVSVTAIPRWWRARRRDLILLAIPVVTLFVLTAKWWAWAGDWGWGPRLIVPIIPLFALPALDAIERAGWPRRIFLLLAAAGLYVQVLGISVDYGHFIGIMEPIVIKTTGRDPKHPVPLLRDPLLVEHFVPELSPIVGQQWLIRRYFRNTPWRRSSSYPWKSLGIPSWRPRRDPTPRRLNYWVDTTSSKAAWCLELELFVTVLASGYFLFRRRAVPTPTSAASEADLDAA
ncbi:MAG: hypothetical protein ABW321_19120 [Polyangiales bacterium]